MHELPVTIPAQKSGLCKQSEGIVLCYVFNVHTGEISIRTAVGQKRIRCREVTANTTISDLLYIGEGISARLAPLPQQFLKVLNLARSREQHS